MVMRVVPRLKPLRQAGRTQGGPGEAEHRAAEASTPGRHPRQGPRAGATGQPEQHRLGLVVTGVAEQHRRSPGLPRLLLKRGVPGAACRGLRATGSGRHGHPDLPHWVEPQGEQRRLDPGGLRRRSVLQAMVYGHGAAAQPQPGCLVG